MEDQPNNGSQHLSRLGFLQKAVLHFWLFVDWTLRESARAKIKVLVKRILRKHGYPPDLEEEATKTVLAQTELLCADWVTQ